MSEAVSLLRESFRDTVVGRAVMETRSAVNLTPPLMLRDLLISIWVFAGELFAQLSHKYKLFHLVRYLFVSSLLLFLRVLPSFLAVVNFGLENFVLKAEKVSGYVPKWDAGVGGGGDSSIARALTQLLSLVNNVPVSSRKYELVRSLAERMIDDNHSEGFEALREVNRSVLAGAFARTLRQLEDDRGNIWWASGLEESGFGPVVRVARSVGGAAWAWVGWAKEGPGRNEFYAEKLAAELLWLAQKMAACGTVEDAVSRWASASSLATVALSAEPRLQCSLVKVTAFLFIEAKKLGEGEVNERKKEELRQIKMNMLMSWLPLLCQASNGTEAPVLSTSGRTELERALEETIQVIGPEEEQEKVLSLWLHHFTCSPNTDWPNLHASYARWCNASRKLLLLK